MAGRTVLLFTTWKLVVQVDMTVESFLCYTHCEYSAACTRCNLFVCSSSESVISLCWVPQHSQLIAVGGDKGVLNIYDLRQGNQNAMTCMAHTHTTTRLSKKVKGIRSDPFNCNLIATFSDLSGEPVKVLHAAWLALWCYMFYACSRLGIWES